MNICQHLPSYTHTLWLRMLFLVQSIILYNDSLWLNLDRLPLCLCLHLCVVSIFFAAWRFSPPGSLFPGHCRFASRSLWKNICGVSLSIAKRRCEWHVWMWFSALHIKVDWLFLADLAEIQNNNIVSDRIPRFLLGFLKKTTTYNLQAFEISLFKGKRSQIWKKRQLFFIKRKGHETLCENVPAS